VIAVVHVLVAFFIWCLGGLIITTTVDADPRYSGAFDHLSFTGELLVIVLWPLALPLMCRRHRMRRVR
jgi:hypothetical protein